MDGVLEERQIELEDLKSPQEDLCLLPNSNNNNNNNDTTCFYSTLELGFQNAC